MKNILTFIAENSIITFLGGIVVGYFLEHFLDWLMAVLRKIPHTLNRRSKEQYEQCMKTDAFIQYEEQALKEYYGSEYFTTVFGREYPVYTIPGKANYPFDALCRPEMLDRTDKKLPFQKGKYYRKYRAVIGENIHRPKMQGYMLDGFDLSPEQGITGVHAWTGTYDENVYTSHILEYELYRAFRKDAQHPALQARKLILRDAVQNGKTTQEVLTCGCGRASLLGVQLLIVLKDAATGRYQALMIKRSMQVAARPGFYQFAPSGGFEVFENSDEHDPFELTENYNVLWAIYREYMEELILGRGNDYEYGQGGETITKIEHEAEIRELKGYLENKTAFFEFLGSAVDLCGLRNELSFVLRIDDPAFSEKKFQSNSESKKIDRVFLEDLEQKIDPKKINPPSAALWYLFTRNHLYKEIEPSFKHGEKTTV